MTNAGSMNWRSAACHRSRAMTGPAKAPDWQTLDGRLPQQKVPTLQLSPG